MEPPVLTRHRRPFLAPFWVMWLLFLLLLGAAFVAYRAATTTTVVLLRHAEKELVTIDDPPLSAAGEQRAERLAQMFGDVRGAGRIDGLYVTDTRRAQQTAMPLALRLGEKPTVLPAQEDLGRLTSRVLSEHRGGRALIVGHSNTVPELVRLLSGQTVPAIGDDEYDNIYIVTVPTFGKANVLRLKY
ncbi:MAG TPA: phosphoglycerate mutase family protein [Steroidobacteraceae bacterium]|jgi:broad specificity phosphatase PhoE|nr:phosphoglycerate mutase family protein [Steroidobacteraceae bacterium]